MTPTMSGPLSRPQGPVGDQELVTVSRGAGRLLFALLLSVDPATELSRLANIPTKSLQVYIDELIAAEVQVPDPADMTTPIGVGFGREGPRPEGAKLTDSKPTEASIPQRSDKIPVLDQVDPSEFIDKYQVGAEDELEAACLAADQIEEPLTRMRAQAAAVVRAWQVLFPKTNEVQELQKQTAKDWVKKAGSASTVFGWMGGVDDEFLLTREYPKAWVNKIISSNAEKRPQGAEGVPGEWKKLAQQIIDQGGNKHGVQDSGGSLLRIAQRVQVGAEEPS